MMTQLFASNEFWRKSKSSYISSNHIGAVRNSPDDIYILIMQETSCTLQRS